MPDNGAENHPNNDVAADYVVPDVSVWKSRHLWMCSFLVVSLTLFCEVKISSELNIYYYSNTLTKHLPTDMTAPSSMVCKPWIHGKSS